MKRIGDRRRPNWPGEAGGDDGRGESESGCGRGLGEVSRLMIGAWEFSVGIGNAHWLDIVVVVTVVVVVVAAADVVDADTVSFLFKILREWDYLQAVSKTFGQNKI